MRLQIHGQRNRVYSFNETLSPPEPPATSWPSTTSERHSFTAHVSHIHGDALLIGSVASATGLPNARETGPDTAIMLEIGPVFLDFLPDDRPGSCQAHFTRQNIEQLQKFILLRVSARREARHSPVRVRCGATRALRSRGHFRFSILDRGLRSSPDRSHALRRAGCRGTGRRHAGSLRGCRPSRRCRLGRFFQRGDPGRSGRSRLRLGTLLTRAYPRRPIDLGPCRRAASHDHLEDTSGRTSV